MRYLRIIPVLMALLLIGVVVAHAVTIPSNVNEEGTTYSPVPVGTSTPVMIIPPGNRCSIYFNWVEAGDLVCAPVRSGTTADFTAAATTGYRFVHGAPGGYFINAMTGDPRLGWSCVSSTGTLNVYTLDFYNCAQARFGP
jgi:hypothetical protein